MPNNLKRIINHKILHKIGKQWVIISASLLIMLTGAMSIHSVHAQSTQKSPVMRFSSSHGQSSVIDQKAQNLHNQISIPRRSTSQISVQKHATRTALYKKSTFQPHYYTKNDNGIKMYTYPHSWKTYLIPTNRRTAYIFSNSDVNNLKSNHTDNLLNDVSDVNNVSPTRISVDGSTYADNQELFNTYLKPLHNYCWVLPSETNFNKYNHFSESKLQHFLNYADKHNLRKYYHKSDIKRINKFRNQYQYLSNYDNYPSTKDNLPYFRTEIVNWLNFYRNMNQLTPVKESYHFDKQAQQSAKVQSDIEDMNWGLTKPRDIIQSYVTDANDVDHNGIAGHRASVLNPISNRVGIGQVGKVNALFFNYGLGETGKDKAVEFPYNHISPISDDINANCWSYRNSDLGNQAQVNVYDKTSHKKVAVHQPVVVDDTVYYTVNPNAIHTDHIYHIIIKSHGMKTARYNTEPFGINQL